MELRSGTALAMQQLIALLNKNMWLARRRKSTLFKLFFSAFMFLFALFLLEKVGMLLENASPANQDVHDPPVKYVSVPIPPCENFSVRRPCYDFVWSGSSSSSPRIQRIIDSIMANNLGRPIPSSKVMSFRTPDEAGAWLWDNPARTPIALHLFDKNATVISYGLQLNSSVSHIVPSTDIPRILHVPLQIAAEREIARTLIGDPNLSWTIGMRQFAHTASKVYSNLFDMAGKTCLFLITAFLFQNQLINLIIEKEQKLRQAMNIMGLYDSAYWLSWLVWEFVMVFLTTTFILIIGLIFRFQFFTKNSFFLLFFVFFVYQLSMTALAFALSTMVSRSQLASKASTFVVASFFMLQIFELVFTTSVPKVYKITRNLLPIYPFNNALTMLMGATSENDYPGMSWKHRNDCPASLDKCSSTIDGSLRHCIGLFFFWLLVTLYLDNILPSENGIPKSPFYFLNPGYWTGRGGIQAFEKGIFSFSTPQPEQVTPDDIDVLEEENSVKEQVNKGAVDPGVAVQIQGLVKTYTNYIKRLPPFHSVKGLWVNFPKDQLFCLLGHNGAGKTTTISCLTGIVSVSGGDAIIYGHSVRSSVGMTNIRKIIGVCPQFDILWDVLSGEEHLLLFSHIKGLPPDSIPTIVAKLLEDVQLARSAKVRSNSYSGGMRRRLSVAAALIGDPKLVILDEPTTGMDPLTRRHVWDIIEAAKRGRAIVLTTHSMEEADVLSDRIGIMAKGKLRCIGTSIRLKMRFGTGFVANMSFDSDAAETAAVNNGRDELKQLFKTKLHVEPSEETKSYVTYIIPHEKEPLLKGTFGEVQDRQREFGITDIQLGLATLEEVFLNVAHLDEDKEGGTGKLVTLNLKSGASIQIPEGARFVGIPGTESVENPQGTMVEVYWGEDEAGGPEILGHSPEKPIPRDLELSVPNKSATTEIQGIVIDPTKVSSESFS